MRRHHKPLVLAFIAFASATLAGCGSAAQRTAPTRPAAEGSRAQDRTGNTVDVARRIDQICGEVNGALYALTQRAGETAEVLERAAEYDRREVRAFDALPLPPSAAAPYRQLRSALLRRSALRLRLARELRAGSPREATLARLNAVALAARRAAARMQLERCPSF